MSVVNVNDVSICYVTGDLKNIGLKEYITRRMTRNYTVEKFWADRQVGTNGAGKSTLLKAITGIMKPTEGSVSVKGNIAALLELASGFDGELTVKENTYLRGALLGYTREFMDQKYDEIIEFAELEEFQDRMFQQLSSGMKSRLGFSIASLIDPDIIILDEVLSVGDGAFREKSSRRMREILDGGVTGMLVSHSISQVRELCNKALWLDHGNQIAFGDMEPICDAYEHFLAQPKNKKTLPKGDDEIMEISKQFRLYKELAAEEKVKKKGDKMLKYETETARENRWMAVIADMPSEERERLYTEHEIS